jgi:SH3 domain protein
VSRSKALCALLITAGFALPAGVYAQDTTSAPADTRYVRDWLTVSLRQEPSATAPVVRQLETGTRLTPLRESDGFVQVRTDAGVTGWIPARFLSDERPAREQLKETSAELERLGAAYAELQQRHASLPEDMGAAAERIAELQEQNAALAAELETLQSVPDDVAVLRASNIELERSNEALQQQISDLTREVADHRAGTQRQQFINGAAAVGAGMIGTLLIAWLWPRKKRSEW